MYYSTYSPLIKYWPINTDWLFLNHGSFGACPKAILEKQHFYQNMLESQPIQFMTRELPVLLNKQKSVLAEFLNAPNDDIVFVNNATTGVNTVLNSLSFQSGEEIVITNHIYPACRNAVSFFCKRNKINLIEIEIPFPIKNDEEILDRFRSVVNKKSRLICIDHVTSQTGLLFPVEKIIKEFQNDSTDVLIDGAHAPGTISLNLGNLKPAYYTGNCHKWLNSPKGSAFLYIRPDLQQKINPLVISLFAGDTVPFSMKFFWQGTDDPSAWLCVADSINFMKSLLPGGWNEIMTTNHNLAIAGRKLLCEALNTELPCPENMIANLASVPIPDSKDVINPSGIHFDSLQDNLFKNHKTELFVTYWPQFPKRLIRISPQIYNSIEQYQILAEYLKKEL